MSLRFLLAIGLFVLIGPFVLLAPAIGAEPIASPDLKRSLAVATRDAARSAANFATGKTLYEKGDLAGALQAYERAYQWSIGSPADEKKLLAEIIPLAFSLERPDEAIRYTLISAETDANVLDAKLLRRLALYATQQREYDRAIGLYRLWLAQRDSTQADQFEQLMVQLELGRLEAIAGDPLAASRAFEEVQSVLILERTAATTPNAANQTAQRLRAALGGSLGMTWEIFGEQHLEADRPALAKQAFRQMVGLSEVSQRANYWLAVVAEEHGEPLDAYDLLQAYFASPGDPIGEAPYELLGDTLRKLNDQQNLPADLLQIAATRPASAYAKLARAQQLAKTDQTDEATNQLARLVSESTTSDSDLLTGITPPREPLDEAALSSAASWLVERYAELQQVDRLLELVDRFYERDESLWLIEDALSKACKNQEFATALFAVVDKPLSTSPKRNAAALGELAIVGGRFDLAERYYQAAIESHEVLEQRQRLALGWVQGLLTADALGDAADALRWAIGKEIWPADDGTPLFHLAAALLLDKQPEGALQAAEQASSREPNSAEFAARVAWVLSQSDRPAEAIKRYEALIKKFGTDFDPATRNILHDARLSLSYLVLAAGNHQAAEELALQVLDEFPDDIGARNDLGYLWASRGEQLARAEQMIQQAVDAKPDTYAYWDSLAWVKHQRGNHAEALEAMTQAIDLHAKSGAKPDGEVLDHLGDILNALGRTDEAKSAWQRSADAYEAAEEKEQAAKVREKRL